MSTFRVKLFALWLIAIAAFLVLESELPALYRNAALGIFLILVIVQFYVRCETCKSSVVTYFTDSRDDWKRSVSFPTAVLSNVCPKCDSQRI